MIEFKSTIPLESESYNYFNKLDDKLREFIKSKIKETAYSSFSVGYKCEIIDCKKGEPSYNLSHNASPNIDNSLQFCTVVDNYLVSQKNQIESYLPSKCTFQIKLNFDKKDNSEMETSPIFYAREGKYTFDQIVLPEESLQEIFAGLNLIELQDLIYDTWNFISIDPKPRCILNFYGKPGTGKTMAAHAIARKLHKKILALNYSEIESKYVGDAAKNLTNAFNFAKKNDCILFFDEADSFLGKRIENVTQGADQALNSLRSQMLILLEEFEGIVIFATNLVKNFDVAFESRILKQIQFNLPDEAAKKKIIVKMIPAELPMKEPLSEYHLKELSDAIGEVSPRDIKNAILDCITNKASIDKEKSLFCFDDFLDAFKKKKESISKLTMEKKVPIKVSEELKNKIFKAKSNKKRKK